MFALSYLEAKAEQKVKLKMQLEMAKDRVRDLERDLKNENEMIDLWKINQHKAFYQFFIHIVLAKFNNLKKYIFKNRKIGSFFCCV